MYQDPSVRALAKFEDLIISNDKVEFRVGERFLSARNPDDDDFTVACATDWRGPFASVEDARANCEFAADEKGLYLVIGFERNVDDPRRDLQLVSMGKVAGHIDDQHWLHRIDLQRPVEIWIGECRQPLIDMNGRSGRPLDLWQAKWAWVRGLKPNLNGNMTENPPQRRVILRNYFPKNQPIARRNASDWLPDIIDYPYREADAKRPGTIHLYWLDDKSSEVIRHRTVNLDTGAETTFAHPGGRPAAKQRGFPWLRTALVALMLLAAVALGYVWTERNNIPSEETVKRLEAKVAQLEQEVADLKAEIEDWIAKHAQLENLLAESTARNQALRTDNDELAKQNEILKSRLEDTVAAEPAAASTQGEVVANTIPGLDYPPCWRRQGSEQPDYLFNATISADGIRLDKAYTDHSAGDYADWPVDAIVLNTELTIPGFTNAVEPIYKQSMDRNCRHFVRLIEGRHDNVETYKAQRAAIEGHFYIYRP